MPKPNMASRERILRAAVSFLFFYLGAIALWGQGFAVIWYLVGGILLVTAILGYCPLYALLPGNGNRHR